jgi:hypothetical protein
VRQFAVSLFSFSRYVLLSPVQMIRVGSVLDHCSFDIYICVCTNQVETETEMGTGRDTIKRSAASTGKERG